MSAVDGAKGGPLMPGGRETSEADESLSLFLIEDGQPQVLLGWLLYGLAGC